MDGIQTISTAEAIRKRPSFYAKHDDPVHIVEGFLEALAYACGHRDGVSKLDVAVTLFSGGYGGIIRCYEPLQGDNPEQWFTVLHAGCACMTPLNALSEFFSVRFNSTEWEFENGDLVRKGADRKRNRGKAVVMVDFVLSDFFTTPFPDHPLRNLAPDNIRFVCMGCKAPFINGACPNRNQE
jgi:hypothetical protein